MKYMMTCGQRRKKHRTKVGSLEIGACELPSAAQATEDGKPQFSEANTAIRQVRRARHTLARAGFKRRCQGRLAGTHAEERRLDDLNRGGGEGAGREPGGDGVHALLGLSAQQEAVLVPHNGGCRAERKSGRWGVTEERRPDRGIHLAKSADTLAPAALQESLMACCCMWRQQQAPTAGLPHPCSSA